MNVVSLLLDVAAIGLIVAGCWLIAPPVALIVAGVLLLAVAWLTDRTVA
jgi:hypothetical protein